MAIVGQGITAYPQPDDALNENSKNPVQNKVVAKEVNELKSAIVNAASIDNAGLITYKHGNTQLFTLQLPLYSGGVS